VSHSALGAAIGVRIRDKIKPAVIVKNLSTRQPIGVEQWFALETQTN
jgi:hypothetical protein